MERMTGYGLLAGGAKELFLMACATQSSEHERCRYSRCRYSRIYLDHVHEENLRAQRVAVGDDGLIAVVADRHAVLAIPTVQLHAAAAALQHLGVLLCGRDAPELVARQVGVVAGIDPIMAKRLRHISCDLEYDLCHTRFFR
jgi:hypothetical protein